MIINVFAVGKNMPSWVNIGFNEYAKRLPKPFSLNLVEIPAVTRTKNCNIEKIKTTESEALSEATSARGFTIALDEHGIQISTNELSERITKWQEQYREINFVIGGPDGLSPSFIASSHAVISLSKLTLPHPLVRVVLAEQIYRAYSIIAHHPYHRE